MNKHRDTILYIGYLVLGIVLGIGIGLDLGGR